MAIRHSSNLLFGAQNEPNFSLSANFKEPHMKQLTYLGLEAMPVLHVPRFHTRRQLADVFFSMQWDFPTLDGTVPDQDSKT